MKHKLEFLQISRGFAAMLVILYHLRDTSASYFNITAFNDFFSFGNLGVDYFFILSGFIITYVHYSDLVNGTNPFNFLKKRLIRIYPTYWVIATITLFVLVVVLNGKSPHLDHDINIRSFSEWKYISGCYLLLPMNHQYFLQLAWTLSYEILFYLLFFIAIIIGFRYAKILLVTWVFFIIIQIPFGSFHGAFLSKLLNGVNLEFMTGCLIAYLFRNQIRIPKWISYIFLIVIPLIFFFKVFYTDPEKGRTFFDLILVIIFYGTILYNLVEIDIFKKYKSSVLLLNIGEASYSIYLSHTFFLGGLGRIFSKYMVSMNLTNGLLIQIVLIIIFLLTVGGGVVCYKYLEKPLIDFLNKRLVTPAKNRTV